MSLLLYGNIRKGSTKYVAKVQQKLVLFGANHDLLPFITQKPRRISRRTEAPQNAKHTTPLCLAEKRSYLCLMALRPFRRRCQCP